MFRNLTSIEDLSHAVKVWTIAVHLRDPPKSNEHPPYQVITYPLVIDTDNPQKTSTFAILHSMPGENPFDLGTFGNWQSVMGYTLWDWLLPFRQSPSCDHASAGGEFPMGPVLDRMMERAGIMASDKRRRKRRRTRSSQTRNSYLETESRYTADIQKHSPETSGSQGGTTVRNSPESEPGARVGLQEPGVQNEKPDDTSPEEEEPHGETLPETESKEKTEGPTV